MTDLAESERNRLIAMLLLLTSAAREIGPEAASDPRYAEAARNIRLTSFAVCAG